MLQIIIYTKIIQNKVKQYHKRFYFYGKTVPELLDKINEFTKEYSVGNIFDVSIMEVLDKQIETDEKKYNKDGVEDSDRIKISTFEYSYYAIILILIEEWITWRYKFMNKKNDMIISKKELRNTYEEGNGTS